MQTTLARWTAPLAVLLLVLTGCEEGPATSLDPSFQAQHDRAGPAAISQQNLVQVTAKHGSGGHAGGDWAFEVRQDGSPTTQIPAGWTTFELDNHSAATHFVYLARAPQGALDGAAEDGEELLDYWYEHVTRPFQWFMDTLIEGKDPDPDDLSDKYTTAEGIFPPWFFSAVPMGGPGFTQGFETSRTTVHLDPGHYIMECYVKNGDGDFHSYRGMMTLLTVTEEQSGANEPRPTMTVDLRTGEIRADEAIRPGLQTVAVRFEEQSVYSHLLGHDVHLLRLDDGALEDATNGWMNWLNPDGLVSTSGSPGPSTFLGGAQTMTAGSTAYFTVNLTPGEYAWVSEVPAAENMWHAFSVPGKGSR